MVIESGIFALIAGGLLTITLTYLGWLTTSTLSQEKRIVKVETSLTESRAEEDLCKLDTQVAEMAREIVVLDTKQGATDSQVKEIKEDIRGLREDVARYAKDNSNYMIQTLEAINSIKREER